MTHLRYWRGLREAELAKPPGEQDQSLLQRAMKEEAEAAKNAAPYLHSKRANAPAPVDEKAKVCVIRAPLEQFETGQEWLDKCKPRQTETLSMEILAAIKKFEALDRRLIGTAGFKAQFDAIARHAARRTAPSATPQPGRWTGRSFAAPLELADDALGDVTDQLPGVGALHRAAPIGGGLVGDDDA
jgi:hypothetical protein